MSALCRLSVKPFCAGLLLAGVVSCSAAAQAVRSGAAVSEGTETPNASNNNAGPTGIIPQDHGFNASLLGSGQHDSLAGWAGVLTPSVAYRLNTHLSFDASIPIYTYLQVAKNPTTKTNTAAVTAFKNVHDVVGDTEIAAHLDLPLGQTFSYTFTPTLGLPSGNSTDGVGAGQVSYDLNNHFEADVRFSPFIEAGFGDTSNLLNRRVVRAQTTVGNLAHFEAGGGISLPRHIDFNASMYEYLPIGDQNIYATKTVRKKTVTRVTGTTGLAEDNGFNSSLDIPVQRHVTVSAFYTHSLRQHSDTEGIALALFLKPRHLEDLDDK